ncbi:MAG: hypothetical protein CMJ32_01210 [Phycisphaerae bacterium]|nr:hypothetical protein [Phycisphaerae bacterium]
MKLSARNHDRQNRHASRTGLIGTMVLFSIMASTSTALPGTMPLRDSISSSLAACLFADPGHCLGSESRLEAGELAPDPKASGEASPVKPVRPDGSELDRLVDQLLNIPPPSA